MDSLVNFVRLSSPSQGCQCLLGDRVADVCVILETRCAKSNLLQRRVHSLGNSDAPCYAMHGLDTAKEWQSMILQVELLESSGALARTAVLLQQRHCYDL
jgi:hypothetical protein